MSIKVYVNTSNKRAETSALLDSGATENFITTHYANWLRLPIKQLPRARKVCNVDGTTNKQGDITHFTDLEVQTGTKRIKMRFFLTDLGEQKVILGYPWFAAMQPKVDWACAWIDYEQLPVVLRTPDAHRAVFSPARDQLSRVKVSPLAPAPVKRTTGGMGKSWEPAPCSDYRFCQYVSPSVAHDSGPCDCMSSPSPFGPFR